MTAWSDTATRLRHALVTALRPRGKLAFVAQLPRGARVLDVGCGNNSPRDFKLLRPDLAYHGVDVGDYNQQDASAYADQYLVVPSSDFAATVASFGGTMDAVVSSHNLEHCDDPQAVLDAMLAALRPGGCLFLAFPCEASADFPHRRGTLNFFDDPTHQRVPRWDMVLERIHAGAGDIMFQRQRYRPQPLATAGLLLEPLGWLLGRNMPASATWALYGFESVLWVRRPAA